MAIVECASDRVTSGGDDQVNKETEPRKSVKRKRDAEERKKEREARKEEERKSEQEERHVTPFLIFLASDSMSFS